MRFALLFGMSSKEGEDMKRVLMSVFAVACMCALCVGLAGCGSGGSSGSAASSSAASASASAASGSSVASQSSGGLQPAANVDPAKINPGAPDVWHLNGDPAAEGIRFEKSSNAAGLAFVRVSASGEDGDGEFNLVITDDLHLRTPLGTAPKIDIVFYDDKNCYDYVRSSWYSRA